MCRVISSLVLTLFSTIAYAQESTNIIRVTPLNSGEFQINTLSTGSFLLFDLDNSNYQILPGDEIGVYGPGSETGVIRKVCFGDQCRTLTSDGELSYPSGFLGNAQLMNHPIGIYFVSSPKTGVYEISIKREGKVDHKRTFTIVDPAPIINSMTVTNYDGTPSTNSIKIDKDQSLDQIRLKFVGPNTNLEFESVKLQGLSLVKNGDRSGEYKLGADWTLKAIAELSLGEAEILFKRKYSQKPSRQKITLTSPAPVINDPVSFEAGINDSEFSMVLSVQNLFKNAKVVLKNHSNHPDFLEEGGNLRAVIDPTAGTLSRKVFFNTSKLTPQAKFIAQIINQDGTPSREKTIEVKRKAENLQADAYTNSRPLISGLQNKVLIKRTGGTSFNLDANSKFKIAFTGFKPIEIEGQKETNDSFYAEFDFPDGLPENVRFTLEKNGSTWSGSFKKILNRPLVNFSSLDVYRGSSFNVYVQNAENVILRKDKNDLIDIQEIANGTDKTFKIEVAEEIRITEFSLKAMLKDHLIKEEVITISNWPKPIKSNLSIQVKNDSTIFRKDILVLNNTNEIKLSMVVDTSKYAPRFSAQLIKTDGTKLGSPKPFILSEQSQVIETTIAPVSTGLQRGERFVLEVVNPVGEAISQSGYIKRNGRDKWIFTAGISALDIPFDDNEEDGSSANVFQGVNLAAYYMLENVYNPKNRHLGVGANALFSEDDGDIELRGAVSLLFFEKLVLGVSFNKDDLGLLIGANIQLADLGSLIGGE